MTNLTTQTIDIEADLLSTSHHKELMDLVPELQHAYSTRQIFRTETEARISVLDDVHFPTKASKYWQSVREQTAMLEQLSLLSFEFRRNEVALKKARRVATTVVDDLDREEAQIVIDECEFKKAGIKQVAADRIREIKMWSMLKHELNDGSFDTSDVNTHQLVSYTVQFAIRASQVDLSQLNDGEHANLTGQLTTSLRRCKELGVIQQVMSQLPQQISESLVRQLT